MNAHQIIDRYVGAMPKTELLFLVWFYSKFPSGVLVRNIDYPSLSSDSTHKYLRRLERQGLIKWCKRGSIYAEVFPCQ